MESDSSFFSTYVTNIFEMVKTPVIILEQNSKKSLLAIFQIAVKPAALSAIVWCVFFIMTDKSMHERNFALESVTRLDVAADNAV